MTTRPTATIRDTDQQPLDRNDYAAHLAAKLAAAGNRPWLPLLSEPEALVVSDLLDELAGVYSGERLGALAREMSVRLCDRLGI